MLQVWFALHTLLWSVGIKIGSSVLSLNVVLLLPIGLFWLLRKFRISKNTLFISAAFILFLLLSFGVARLGPCEDKFAKALISAPLLAMLLIISLEIGARATPEEWLNLRTTAFRIMVVAFLFIICEMLLPKFFSPFKLVFQKEYKYSGIFYEPSHVAISLFPCIAILLSSKNKSYKNKGIISLVLLFLLSRSSTLVMLTLFFVVYSIVIKSQLKQGLKYLTVIVLVISIAVTLNYDLLIAPTVERVDSVASLIVEEVTSTTYENMSSMIYLKGWQDAIDNIIRSSGLGLGFNMMGCSPLPDTPLRRILSLPGRSDVNNEDGSFLLSKMLSEFGIIGFVFFMWGIWWWLKYEKTTNKFSEFEDIEVASVHKMLMFSFVISSLIRSTGYFQGTVLIWATTIIASAGVIRKIKKAKKRF